jgi:hypothetical protein
MFKYQIVYPVRYDIYGDSFKEAVKNYVKLKHDYDINKIIIADQSNHAYEAKLRYYMENQKNKVGIDFYPFPYNNIPLLVLPNTPLITTSNTNSIVYSTPNALLAPSPIVTSNNTPFATSASNVFLKF